MTDAAPEGPLVCSAKGCQEPATHAVLWNNPKIHTPERRKTWLACPEHELTLRAFLSARGFYKETRTVDAV
ncbi:acetone carboxylase [Solicola sp. PLA-1-18]|uniref:acetone carboxylase n=1 Tax=Solicola sp. PLA-1-18 TaxID=3380532 RepID=UPI003B765649